MQYLFPENDGGSSFMKKIEHAIEAIILASRWLLVVFYLGLTLALLLYAISFGKKLMEFVDKLLVLQETDTILKMLSLIDAALVASLVVMVIISGYENFVSRFDNAEGTAISWLGKLDASSLKIKVASTIVAISSIHLLQVFLNAQQYTDGQLMWLTLIHLTFVITTLLLAYIDKLMATTKKTKGE